MKTALFFKLLFVCLACVAIRPVSAQVLGAGVFELKGHTPYLRSQSHAIFKEMAEQYYKQCV